MNKIIKFVLILTLLTVVNVKPVFAQGADEKQPSGIFYGIGIDIPKGAVQVSRQKSVCSNGSREVIKYRQNDGTYITDTITHNRAVLTSKKGNDTVSRSKEVKNWGTVFLTATFDWYTNKYAAYVQCSSVSSSATLINKKKTTASLNTSKSNGYVMLGKAYGKVDYNLYNTKNPVLCSTGNMKITCSDTGAINDK
ncbi:MAG: hypothetical protein K6G76_01390 [Lachnospiraceae bacterium]|nr:hypothetical protein [Lachnospiraceae bacterium]